MKKCPAWKKGDLIDIVAPGSGVSEEQLRHALEFLVALGFRVRTQDPLFNGHPYISNADEKRYEDLIGALKAKDSVGVWCLRGGYGSIRLVPRLLKQKPPTRPKLLLGYSDITSLHIFLNQKWKWIAGHGPLLESLSAKKYSASEVDQLFRILSGEEVTQKFALAPANKPAEKPKTIEGELCGGNLITLMSHFGTRLAPQLQNKILFLEEIGERGYRLDRLFAQLLQVPSSLKLRAVVLGQFLGGAEKDGFIHVENALGAFITALEERKIPVFSGLPVGHGSTNRLLFCGGKAEISKFSLIQSSGIIA